MTPRGLVVALALAVLVASARADTDTTTQNLAIVGMVLASVALFGFLVILLCVGFRCGLYKGDKHKTVYERVGPNGQPIKDGGASELMGGPQTAVPMHNMAAW